MGHYTPCQTRFFRSELKGFFELCVLSLILTISGCNKDDDANTPPVADAGDDTKIEFPAQVVLDGSASYDPDGNISGWLWSQIAGPSKSNIDSSGSSNTIVNNLMEGDYKFELKVTDSRGSASRDTVGIAVAVSATTFTFDIEYDYSTHICILSHEDIDDIIPAGSDIDVFLQSGFNGSFSNWKLLPEYPSNLTSYTIVNGDLKIYVTGIDCSFDDADYKARIVVY